MDQNNKHVDFQRLKRANTGFGFRVVGVIVVLVWLGQIVRDFFRGGPEAPDLVVLLTAIVLMGGGAIFVAVISWRAWKAEKAAAVMTEEEVAEMMALRDGEEE